VKTVYVLLLIYFFLCMLSGFLASPKGDKGKRISTFLSRLTLLCGLGLIIYLIVVHQYLYSLAVVAIYIIASFLSIAILKRFLFYHAAKSIGQNNNLPIAKKEILAASNRKTAIMKQIARLEIERQSNSNLQAFFDKKTNAFNNIIHTQEENENEYMKLFTELYNSMVEMPGGTFTETFEKYSVTPRLLYELEHAIADLGYSMVDGVDYIPISLVSFRAPLRFLLEHKDDVIYHRHEARPIVDQAIQLFNSI